MLPFTAHDDSVIRVVSPAVAAEKLGRPMADIEARRAELGVGKPPPSGSRRWTAAEDALVVLGTIPEAARQLGRTAVAVKARRKFLRQGKRYRNR